MVKGVQGLLCRRDGRDGDYACSDMGTTSRRMMQKNNRSMRVCSSNCARRHPRQTAVVWARIYNGGYIASAGRGGIIRLNGDHAR